MNTGPTEADLEARLHAVMGKAFPWLQDAFEHQTQFAIQLGHKTIKVKGRKQERLHGRADILVKYQGTPLTIIELKRADLALTEEDAAQGLSYARLTTPMAPLVVVSNGTEIRIYETYSGEIWKPGDYTEHEFRTRLANVGKLATEKVTDAISVLMGADQDVWLPAIQAVSAELIEQRTGSWDEPLAPFVRDFLIPRHATAGIVELRRGGARVISVSGPPLSGKSSVLRALVEGFGESESAAALMIEPDASGIFGAVSHVLASELGWAVSKEEAREWMRTISRKDGTDLLLLLDGVDSSLSTVIADLNELSSNRFGSHLHLIVASDDSALEIIARKSNGREANAFGRAVDMISLQPLDDAEFDKAREQLSAHHIGLTMGAKSVLALRDPWVLRALVPAADLKTLPKDKPTVGVRIPPLLDVESLHRSADAFPIDEATQSQLMATAQTIIEHYLQSRNPAAVLHGISTFAVDSRRLENTVGAPGVQDLRTRGYIKLGVNWASQSVYFVRAPTLVAKFVAIVLAERLQTWIDPDEAAQNLVSLSTRLPFGEVIAADALVRWATQQRNGNTVLGLISSLFQKSPSTAALMPGTRVDLSLFGKLWHATITEKGLAVASEGKTLDIEIPDEDQCNALSDLGGWLILSHVAALPIGIGPPSDTNPARLDEPLLLEVGQAAVILSQADGALGFKEIAVHDIEGHGSVVCHHAGIVEPITWAMVKFFLHRGVDATDWIDEAMNTSSLALLNRMHIALSYVADNAGATGPWARTLLTERVGPAIDRIAKC